MRQKTNRITSGLLAVAILLGLIGPAIPVSKARDVNAPEPHVHTFACYEEYWLDCNSENSDHNHALDCYAYSGELVCGLEEGEIHIHGNDGLECRLAARILTCDIPEHVHDETCIAKASTDQSEPSDTETTVPKPGLDENLSGDVSDEDLLGLGGGSEEDSSSSIDTPEEDLSSPGDISEEITNEPDIISGENADADTSSDSEDTSDNQSVIEDSDNNNLDIPKVDTSNQDNDLTSKDSLDTDVEELFELAEEELSIAPEYICGKTEHAHASRCYQEIWECRKIPEVDPLINAVGFTATVKNTVVATSDSKRFYFSLRLTEGDENSVIIPENKWNDMFGNDEDKGVITKTYVDGTNTNTFNEVKFTAPGSYKFAIWESGEANKASSSSSYKYDGRIWKLMVEVTEENGQLAANGTYSCPIDYGSAYYPENTECAEFITVYNNIRGWNYSTVRQANDMMKNMSLEEKVGQLFLLHYPGDGSGTVAQAEALIDKYHPGGYLVFAAMFEKSTPTAVRQKIADTQAASSIPLLFSVDEEGGIAASGNRVVRISKYSQYGHAQFQSPQELKASGGLSAVTADSKDKAAFLKDLGLNINHAPVADVSAPGGMMYGRSWGGDGVDTAKYVEALIKAYDGTGVGTTMKHFPGYGATSADTHNGFAVNDLTRDEFDHNDLLPFYAGIAAGGQSVMVTHNTINCLDTENPASLSPAVYNLLRNEMGFDGVAMTDDLAMGAITNFTGAGRASLRALQAGADMAMTSTPDSDIPAVISAVKSGSLSLSEVEEKCRRILCWKIELGLIEEEVIDPVRHNIEFDIEYDSNAQSSNHTLILTQVGSSNHIVMPNTTQYRISESGSFHFSDDIIFNEAGTYKFKLQMTCADGYVTDPEEWMLTVDVTYSNGKLSAVTNYSNETITDANRPSFLIKKVAMSAVAEKFITLTKDLPSPSSVTVDNLDTLRSQIAEIMEVYNRIPDDEKEQDAVKSAKNGRLKDLQTIIDREDNLSDDAKAFIARVNAVVVPSFDVLDEDTFNSFIKQVENLEILYSNSVTANDKKALSVTAIKEKFDELRMIQNKIDKALKYVKAAADINPNVELTYDNYQTLKTAYYDALNKYTEDLKEYPFVVSYIELVEKARVIVVQEEGLSTEARNYVDSVNAIKVPTELTSSSLNWLKQQIARANEFDDALSAEDRSRVYVKEAMSSLERLEKIVGNEENLTARAQAFVISVERISYSIPFTNESFEAFKAAIASAESLYGRLTEKDKSLVVIRDEEAKLRALEAVRDREINLNEAAGAFVDAVNSIRMPNPPEHTIEDSKAQIDEAFALYSNLNGEDLNRLLVINMRAKLETLSVEFESVAGISETAKNFVNAINEIDIPETVTSEFLNTLYSKFEAIDQLYGQLTDEDKEWFSVQKAIQKMSIFIDIMRDKKSVHYEVQYYAYFNQFASEGDVFFKLIDTSGKNLPRNGVTNLKEFYMWLDTGGKTAVGSSGKIKMEKRLTQLYDSGNFNLVSEYDISRVDKLRGKDGYILSEIWVLKEGSDPTSTDENDWIIHTDVDSFTLNPAEDALNSSILNDPLNSQAVLTTSEEETGVTKDGKNKFGKNTGTTENPGNVDLTPAKNVIIRLVYDENTQSKKVPVNFYDYDITDGTRISNNPIQVKTSEYGINHPDNYTDDGTRFTFGNGNTGTRYGKETWEDRYGIANTPNMANRKSSGGADSYEQCTFGIATELVNGKIQYAPNISVPNLFKDSDVDNPVVGKTSYDKGEFTLEFNRFGDTYTLQKVNKGNSTVIDNLDQFTALVKRWKPSTSTAPDTFIWSNSFWPMDYVPSYGSAGHDPAFGATTKMVKSESEYFPTSDDSKNHNAYFGMNFAVNFEVPADYSKSG